MNEAGKGVRREVAENQLIDASTKPDNPPPGRVRKSRRGTGGT